MNQETKQAYLDRSAAQISEWSAKLDVVRAKVAQASADVRIDYHKQIDSWQEKQTAFKQKVDELRASGAEGFETIKTGAQNVWNELSTLVQSLEEKTK